MKRVRHTQLRQGSKVLKKEESSQLCPTSRAPWVVCEKTRDLGFLQHGNMKKESGKTICETRLYNLRGMENNLGFWICWFWTHFRPKKDGSTCQGVCEQVSASTSHWLLPQSASHVEIVQAGSNQSNRIKQLNYSNSKKGIQTCTYSILLCLFLYCMV